MSVQQFPHVKACAHNLMQIFTCSSDFAQMEEGIPIKEKSVCRFITVATFPRLQNILVHSSKFKNSWQHFPATLFLQVAAITFKVSLTGFSPVFVQWLEMGPQVRTVPSSPQSSSAERCSPDLCVRITALDFYVHGFRHHLMVTEFQCLIYQLLAIHLVQLYKAFEY